MKNIVPKIRTLSHYSRQRVDIDVSPVTAAEIPTLHRFIMNVLGPGIATVDTVRAVHARQPFSIWKVRDSQGAMSGTYAFLYLNEEGYTALKENRFNSRAPEIEHLAATPDEVVAIFTWCLVLRGKSKAALLKAATWIDLCGWNERPIFTNPVTPEGTRLARRLGFRPFDETGESNIHVVA